MRRLLLLLLVVVGCGGDDEPKPIEGFWLMDYGPGCGLGLTIENGRYSLIDACPLNTGQIGADVEVGSYTVARGMITLVTEQWTCPGGETTVRLPFALSGDQLTLTSPGGALLMKRQRSTGDAVSGAVQYGCFADDGKFTPAQLRPVR